MEDFNVTVDARALTTRFLVACALARTAGEIAKQRFLDRDSFTVGFKGPQNYLTEVDGEVERLIATRLHEVFPSDGFIGEEGEGRVGHAGQPIWVVDPIDGTSNFANGLPYFAVSVALLRPGRRVLGAVYDPVADEMFCAEAGKGAHLNGTPMPIKEYLPDLAHSMAGVDFKRIPAALAQRLACAPPYSSQRNFGASTLDWCYTAAGRFDVYLHGGQKLWDYAAGSLILEESGGQVSTLEEDDFWRGDVWQRSVVAARNRQLLAAWRAWIKEAYKA